MHTGTEENGLIIVAACLVSQDRLTVVLRSRGGSVTIILAILILRVSVVHRLKAGLGEGSLLLIQWMRVWRHCIAS